MTKKKAFSSLDGIYALGCGVVAKNSAVECWSEYNPYFSTGTFRLPEPASDLAVSVTGYGAGHVCVLTQAGNVVCWGDGGFGQLGYVPTPIYDYGYDLQYGNQRFVRAIPPKKVLKFPSPAKQVFAAGHLSCAWLQDNTLWCWGDTLSFHFADTSQREFWSERMARGEDEKGILRYKPRGSSTMPSSPLKMPEACTPKDITVLANQLCVVCESGCAQCWGHNENNALGYGDSEESWEPRNECLKFPD